MAVKNDTALSVGSVPLGHAGGVALRAHWSVLVSVGLLTVLLGAGELPALVPHAARSVYWLAAPFLAAVFFATIGAHELAHALVARRCGLHPKRMTLWLLGGVTELDERPASPRADFLIAAAGPFCTLVLGAAFYGLAYLAGGGSVIGAGFAWVAVMSIVLAVFNLLPAAPLDGGRILRAAVWRATGDRERADAAATASGRLIGIVLIALGVTSALAGAAGGLWLALVGWFIVGAARGEREAGRLAWLGDLTAADVMVPAPACAPGWWTVADLLARMPPNPTAQPAFPLTDIAGVAVGAVTLADLERVPTDAADDTRLTAVRRLRPFTIVPGTTLLTEVVPALARGAPGAVVVDEEGRPIGVLDAGAVQRAVVLARLRGRESALRS